MKTFFVAFLTVIICEIFEARFVPVEDNTFSPEFSTDPTYSVNENQFPGDDQPSFRIHIKTNGNNVAPYIFLRRRPNTNMRLRIQRGTTANNEPLRIVYRQEQERSNIGPFEENNVQSESIPNFRLNPSTRGNANRIFLDNRRSPSIRFQ